MKIIPLIVAASLLTAAADANNTTVTRYTTFVAAGAGEGLNANVDGMAVITHRDFTARVQVMMRRLQPHTTYDVLIGDTYLYLGAIHTNPAGNGHFNAEFTSLFPIVNEAIQIFVYDGDPEEVFVVTPSELRAIAVPE